MIILITAKNYYNEHKDKIKIGYQFYKNDIIYTKRNILKINSLGLIIGILSSMLGIGGGIIFAPVFFLYQI